MILMRKVKQVERPKNNQKIQRGMERSNLMERKSQSCIIMLQVFCVALKMVFDWSSSQFWTELLKLWKAGWSNKLASLMFALSLFWCQIALRLIQGRLEPKFYSVHFPFSAFFFCVWRPIYCGSAFGTCVFDFPLNCFIPQLSTI
jgi:hypothetical protein